MTTIFPTISSRSILIPELASKLTIEATELSSELSNALAASGTEQTISSSDPLNIELTQTCQAIFGIPWPQVITFSRWRDLHTAALHTLTSSSFKQQIIESYGGNNHAERQRISKWIEDTTSRLQDLDQRFSTIDSFIEGVIRNVLLNPFAPRQRFSSTSVLNYQGEPTLLQSLLWDVRERGFAELEVLNWQHTAALLNAPAPPSCKAAFLQLQEYEFPVPGSPKLKFLTLEQFRKGIRGAALIPIGTAAYHSNSFIQAGDLSHLLVCVVSGVATALIFIAAGQAAAMIEGWKFGAEKKPSEKKAAG